MVRAGQGATFVEDFIDKKVVAIGWSNAGDIKVGESRESITQKLTKADPGKTSGHKAISASQRSK